VKTEAKVHPRSGGNRLLAPSIAFDCARRSSLAASGSAITSDLIQLAHFRQQSAFADQRVFILELSIERETPAVLGWTNNALRTRHVHKF